MQIREKHKSILLNELSIFKTKSLQMGMECEHGSLNGLL